MVQQARSNNVKDGGAGGFTLIEVLIAMAIIGIGLIALVTLFPVGLRSSRLAGDFTTASFIAQQALDNIRASAQVYDPGDRNFNSVNGDGLGFFELPISAVKGYFSPIRFPAEPTRSQWWEIEITGAHDPAGTAGTYRVIGSDPGGQIGTGQIGSAFTSEFISFILYDNRDGPEAAPGGWDTVFNEGTAPFDTSDIDYPEFSDGDRIRIYLEVRGGNWYYWYAMRSPVTEDQDLDGLLDGRFPDGTQRTPPHNIVNEDTGLDLVPDFYDINNTGSYEAGLDPMGEFTAALTFPNDPHGDNKYAYHTGTGWWDITTVVNPNGTEGNGKLDQSNGDSEYFATAGWIEDPFIQRVTVTVGWREGGQDRTASFSASIPNQFR